MAHFACIGPLAAGHMNPMAALATELCARGHKATVFNIPDGAPIMERLGVAFEPVGSTSHPIGWFDGSLKRCGNARGLRGYGPLLKDSLGMMTMLCRELPDRLRAARVDMIISDQAEPSGALVAYRLKLPFVSIAAALPTNWEPGIPPSAFPWKYGGSRIHRWRNIAGAFAIKTAIRPWSRLGFGIADEWRLGLGRDFNAYDSGLAQIAQLVPSLDMPRRSLIGCFHYCGPLRPVRPFESTETSTRRDAGRAFASLGTLQGHRSEIFEEIARATAASGLSLTIAHGGRLDGDACQRLSDRAEVHAFVDQTKTLATMDLAILHGGMNTVLDALAAGVPLVVVPLAYEQSAIAARVLRSGAGLVCSPRDLRRGRLPELVAEVRRNPSFAKAAAAVQDDIRCSGGTRRAADIIEDVYRTGRAILSNVGLQRQADARRDAIE